MIHLETSELRHELCTALKVHASVPFASRKTEVCTKVVSLDVLVSMLQDTAGKN